MFGRIREEDYDAYNERMNAKYDDDYIRPTEESRSECAHSHEQTYTNYDARESRREYREECGHSHEQTYEDYNSEQRSYDAMSSLADQFAKRLEPNEQIIWCGKPEPNLTAEESGAGCAKSAGIILMLIGIPLIVAGVGMFIIIMGVLLLTTSNVQKRSYAITDRRLMILHNGTVRSVPLKSISSVTYKSSARNIGYVSFMRRTAGQTANQRSMASDGIFGIKDPAGVSRILQNAARYEYSKQGAG